MAKLSREFDNRKFRADCGLVDIHDYTDEELKHNIIELKIDLRRIPLYSEFMEKSKIFLKGE
jgi:hypothetical protein